MSLTSYRRKYFSGALRLLPPEMRGKARFARLLLGSGLSDQNVQLHARYGCRFVVPSLRESVGFHLLIDGVYEFEAVEFLLRRLRAGSVFIDVGANIGVFTVPAAKKVGLTGIVLAIEPSPRVFPYLKWNVTLNGLVNVRLSQCAAFDQDECILPFYEAPIEHFGMGSLAAQFHDHPIPVPAQTLDHILNEHQIERVDVLKVDVEGLEAAVFRGAERLLTGDAPPLILFEFCDWAEARVPGSRMGDAQRVLREWGYQIWQLSALIQGMPPLSNVLTSGFETLVAMKKE